MNARRRRGWGMVAASMWALACSVGVAPTNFADDELARADDELAQADEATLAEAEAELEAILAEDPVALTQLLQAYSLYLSVVPDSLARARRTVEYAELLIASSREDEALGHLRRALDQTELDPASRTLAARLLVDVLVERWKAAEPGQARIAAAISLRDRLSLLQRDPTIWEQRSADGVALRAHQGATMIALGWDLAANYEQLGLANQDREAFSSCRQELSALFDAYADQIDAAAALASAAGCASRAYQIGTAIGIRQTLITRYPDSPHVRDAIFAQAETYQNVLYFRLALQHYQAFAQQFPEDERAATARGRALQLAVTLGDPIDEIVANWRDDKLDAQMLAAAVEFRSAQQSGDLDALAAYLARYRSEAGAARAIAVRVALAGDAMRRSCPDASRANGLCTATSSDGRLGEVLERDKQLRRVAQRELTLARALMHNPVWYHDPLQVAGPPLALEPEELRGLEAAVALLHGDLTAEEALGLQPPRTYEASRTRLWLDERERSVAEMVGAYERVGANDAARAAVAAERSAQVYESDAALLARVALELRARDEPELAAELEALEADRLSKALAGYQQCLASIVAWGDDPAQVQAACKLGVARVSGEYEREVPWRGDASLVPLLLGGI